MTMDPLALKYPPDVIAAKTAAIHATMLRESPQIKEPNFTVIGTEDLSRLFALYDHQFFGGWLAKTVAEKAAGPVIFRLSSTMTRAGGKTIQRRPLGGGGPHIHYEIAIASRMLFMTFAAFTGIDRPIVACGLQCADRLEALQRIMEHEIMHLVELLVFGRSNCAASRYQELARRIFGHTQSTHALVTPRERAEVQHGIRVGDRVEFAFEGARHVGMVNRIHHRATVLVEASDGAPYSDGKRYHKYYIPLPLLRPIS